jgi:hypothetical protein
MFDLGISLINRLKPSSFFKFQQVLHSKILHGARLAVGNL